MFDETGVPVDSYAAAFYREMEHCVAGTGTPGPREQRFELHPGCYPAPVTGAHLLVKHVERSEPKTHVTYEENWGGERWTCRWGRHENPHNDRDHFHQPPSPAENDDPYAYDAALDTGVRLMETPVEFILDRLNDLATATTYTYPTNYEWTGQYQPERYSRPDA